MAENPWATRRLLYFSIEPSALYFLFLTILEPITFLFAGQSASSITDCLYRESNSLASEASHSLLSGAASNCFLVFGTGASTPRVAVANTSETVTFGSGTIFLESKTKDDLSASVRFLVLRIRTGHFVFPQLRRLFFS